VGFDNTVLALAPFDDGSGPALFAGGMFASADGQSVNHIARWDGNMWQPLTMNGFVGVNSMVSALVVFDDGTGPALYAGGNFTVAGSVPAARVARWDGSSWTAVEGAAGGMTTALNSRVMALNVFDDGSGDALYAGGTFALAGSTLVNGVARWSGEAWEPLTSFTGVGVDGTVNALAVHDDGSGPALYAGGAFTTQGGTLIVNHIARWDGSNWGRLQGSSGIGFNNMVMALASFDDGGGPALYAGGRFTTAGGISASRAAKWHHGAWSPVGSLGLIGSGASVESIEVFDDGHGPALCFGGLFDAADNTPVSHAARWNSDGWSDIAAKGVTIGGAVQGDVRALGVHDDGHGPALFAVGAFTRVGESNFNHLARFKDGLWSELPGPHQPPLIPPYFPPYYASIAKLSTGPAAGVYIGWEWFFGRWDGTQLTTDGLPLMYMDMPGVHAMLEFDDGNGPALFIGGNVSSATFGISSIGRWDGTTFSPLLSPNGQGLSGGFDSPRVRAMAIYDDGSGPALYVAGNFLTAGGVTANRIARWDGAQWSVLSGPNGTGVNNQVNALAVFDDGTGPMLYVGGVFQTAGGLTARFVARWNGSAWSALPVAPTGISLPVTSLKTYDDGTGNALYVGGRFGLIDGQTYNRIARWDGQTWTALDGPGGIGVDGPSPQFTEVSAFAAWNDGHGPALVIGGNFDTAGGRSAPYLAMWRGRPNDPTCIADLNGDGVLDFFDVQLFLGLYAAQDAAADINGDGAIDFFDVQVFLAVYSGGCP
jgi:hypothetical protein